MSDLVKRDPFRSLFSWPRWIEDFEDFSFQRGLKIKETADSIIAEAVVAGVSSDNVEVHIEDGVLTVKAEDQDEQKGDHTRSSSNYQYYYTAALSGGQWDKANAEIDNGVVTVTIPKAEAVRPRKIAVKQKSAK